MSFKASNYLIFNQSKPELDSELLEEFNPWMTTKTFSFYNDGEFINYINDFLNGNFNIFTSKEEQFKYYENIIPKQKYKRITYIKRSKVDKVEEVPIPEFYSRREIDFFENFNK